MDSASLERDLQCMLCTVRFFLIGPDARPQTLETWPFPIVVNRPNGQRIQIQGGPRWVVCGTCHRLVTRGDREALTNHVQAMMTTLIGGKLPEYWPDVLIFLEAWWQNYLNAKLTPEQRRLRDLAHLARN